MKKEESGDSVFFIFLLTFLSRVTEKFIKKPLKYFQNSMATLEKLVVDAKRISNRLNDKLVLGDSLINEIEFVNEQLKTLRTVSITIIIIIML